MTLEDLKIKYKLENKNVVQLNKDMQFIKKFDTISLSAKGTGISYDTILNCCNRKQKTSGGFIWMYEVDYIKYKNGEISCEWLKVDLFTRKVVQLDLNNNYIKTFNSITDASRAVNLKSKGSISSCCKNKRKSAGGFKWFYLEDFEREYKNT